MQGFRRIRRGFTLVELMIVVAIIAVLAALAIYGVTRYLASAKTSEAKNTLGSISRNAQEAFHKEQSGSELVPDGASGVQLSYDLCATSSQSIAAIPAGRKAQPDPATFKVTGAGNSRTVGWQCLKFEMHDPTYYRYGYVASRINPTLPAGESVGGATGVSTVPAKLTPVLAMPTTGFYAVAEGDVDDDGQTSAMGIAGEVNPANRTLKTGTQVTAVDENE
ncbi:MAG: prepilin-type N-terminal cleavage/methylation domain-containing protein [Polyangiaceae bacterium]